MKHSQFRIRNNLNSNYKSKGNVQKVHTLLADNNQYVPSCSSFNYEESNQNFGNNDMFLSLFKNIMESLQSISKSPLVRRNDLEVRDRSYLLQIPSGKNFQKSKQIIKKWVQKMISDIVSISFHYFSNDQFTYQQAKIFCSQNILSNLAALVHKYILTSSQLKEIDQFIRDDVLQLLSKKYPLTQSIVVNRTIQALAKAPDLSEKLQNDFFSLNNLPLNRQSNQNFSKEIKLLVNTIINRSNQQNKIFQQISNFQAFQKLMTKIFESVEDHDWMTLSEKQRNDTMLGFLHNLQYKQSAQPIAKESFFMNKQGDNLRREYKEKVKQYTSYLIGRKVSENVPPFSQQQMGMNHIEIKSTSILRILTKWCQQLWQKFIPKNYFVNKTQDFRLLNGQIKSVSQQMRSHLDKLMQAQKARIKQFMTKVTNDNYEAQINLLKQLLQNSEDQFWQKNLQKISEKFSVLIGKSLQKWVIKYLNRLMEGLKNVANQFYQKYFINEWSSPPNLITFKIGDLMRCKCSSGQRQIRYIFQSIKWLSTSRPEILSITRIKNRLSLGTNDILMNVKFCGTIICEIQLAVNSKKSKFIKASNVMSHYLYQIQRSLFGPINQLGSIWRNLDLRASYFDKNMGGGNNSTPHKCESSKKSFQFEVFDAPFICSICNNTYSHNSMIIKHVKCSQCSFWKCSLCQIKQVPSQKLAQMFVSDSKLRRICEKKVILEEQNNQLPPFGISINLGVEKSSQILIYKKLQIRGVKYIFARQDGKLKLLLKITHDGAQMQYLKQHVVFELNQQNGTNMIQLTEEQANQQYFLPLYISECYKNHKTTITLEKQPINSQNCRNIFKGSQQQQAKITILSLTNTNLTSISPLNQIFPNLQQLTLRENCQITDYDHLERFSKLKELTLKNSFSLYEIPLQIFQLSSIIHLNLKDCLFTKIPPQIGQLKKLKTLNISHSDSTCKYAIRHLPNQFYNLCQLQQLDISGQFILQLSEDIGKLKKLRILNIRLNGLQRLPNAINQLSQLQLFEFRQNPLKQLPKSFASFRKLKEFRLQKVGSEPIRLFDQNIYRSYYETLPEDLQEVQNLKTIDIHSQKLNELPPLEKCQNLQQLNVFRCALLKPPKFKNCKSLKRLIMKQQMLYEQYQTTCISNDLFNQTPNIIYFCGSFNNLKFIPQSIKVLSQLIELDLCMSNIETICEEIGQCRSLQRLILYKNRIKTIPNSFKNLQKLQYLTLNHNNLTQINQSLFECVGLHQLLLGWNKILSLPQSIGNLINLQILDLQQNMIGQLPKSLNNLKKLKNRMLKLYKNPLFLIQCNEVVQKYGDIHSKNFVNGQFTVNTNGGSYQTIPNDIKKANHFTSITIKGQLLYELPREISALSKLTYVDFRQNKFNSFPLPLTDCINLKTILFTRNQIDKIPAEIGKLVNLKKLDVSENEISTIDEDINLCKSLQEIDFSVNKIKKIEDNIFAKLNQLKIIDLNYNQIRFFPKGLLQCQKIEKISLASNKITDIRLYFTKTTSLLHINLQDNQLSEFPEAILGCENLQQLHLGNNKIGKISQNLHFLKKLTYLTMNGTDLTEIPRSIGRANSLTSLNLAINKITVAVKELQQLINMNENQFNLYNNPIKQIECTAWLLEKGTAQTKKIAQSLKK